MSVTRLEKLLQHCVTTRLEILPCNALALSEIDSGCVPSFEAQSLQAVTGSRMVFCPLLGPPRKATSRVKGRVAVNWKMATLEAAAAVLGSWYAGVPLQAANNDMVWVAMVQNGMVQMPW